MPKLDPIDPKDGASCPNFQQRFWSRRGQFSQNPESLLLTNHSIAEKAFREGFLIIP